jgi:hypothetical protein
MLSAAADLHLFPAQDNSMAATPPSQKKLLHVQMMAFTAKNHALWLTNVSISLHIWSVLHTLHCYRQALYTAVAATTLCSISQPTDTNTRPSPVEILSYYFLFWLCSPARAMASSFTRFPHHTQRRATVSRTPVDEWSARRRDLYLTTHNTHDNPPPHRWDSNPRSKQESGRRPTP